MTRTVLGVVLASTSMMAAVPLTASAQVAVGVPAVRVPAPPPPLRTEVRPRQPAGPHAWVPGSWAWRGGHHVWIPGYWGLAPRPDYVWVEPRWIQAGRHA